MILFFDTETTGKADFRMPPTHECQPHLVQLAALLTEDDGTERASFSFIVRPEGWTIPAEAAAIHGITDAIADRVGLPLFSVCRAFLALAQRSAVVVAHNFDFDGIVIEAAFSRCQALGRGDPVFTQQEFFCTMQAATPVCKIPHANPRRPDDWKWPKLEECVRQFFGEELAGAHDAMVDVRACKRVYFHLQSLAREAA